MQERLVTAKAIYQKVKFGATSPSYKNLYKTQGNICNRG